MAEKNNNKPNQTNQPSIKPSVIPSTGNSGNPFGTQTETRGGNPFGTHAETFTKK